MSTYSLVLRGMTGTLGSALPDFFDAATGAFLAVSFFATVEAVARGAGSGAGAGFFLVRRDFRVAGSRFGGAAGAGTALAFGGAGAAVFAVVGFGAALAGVLPLLLAVLTAAAGLRAGAAATAEAVDFLAAVRAAVESAGLRLSAAPDRTGRQRERTTA